MKKIKNYLLALTLLAFTSTGVFAQTETPAAAPVKDNFPKAKNFNSWTVGIFLGPTITHGDMGVVGGENLGDMNFGMAFGGYLNHSLTHTMAVQGNLLMGNLKGSGERTFRKKTYKEDFETKINFEASMVAVFNFGNISYLKRTLPKVNWYMSFGGGLINFEPNSTVDGKKMPEVGTAVFTTYGYNRNSYGKTTEIVFPLGIGFKYKVGKRINLTAEYNLKLLMTDKIDDRKLSYSNSDFYSHLNFGASFTFGKKAQSLEWVNPLGELYSEMSSIRNKMDSLVGDKDTDGVADLYDKDNATPAGVKVYGDGTSMDTDGDGVADASDSEIFSTKGAAVDASGKEMDGDGDGVPDSRDLEPNTEKGKLVNFQGITIKVQAEGATKVQDYDKYWPIVFFDFNKSVIKGEFQDGLAVLARIMTANPGVKVSLFGNCDVVGTEATNQTLGQKRADVVKQYLMDVYSIDGSRIDAISKGKSEPFANPKNKKDKDPMNRRVDYKIMDK